MTFMYEIQLNALFVCLFAGPCPEGTYCPGATPEPIGCAAGTYNDLTTKPACFNCPEGYYCPANSTTYLDTPCLRGKNFSSTANC